jgi:predicted phage terminase large subunit-like protein
VKTPSLDDSLRWAISNHGIALIELEARIGASSFYHFCRMAWSQVDPDDYVDNWHIKAICDHLQAMVEGRLSNRKLMINIPPSHSKSLITSVFFPAWCWISRPWLRFMCTAYRADLALRDSRRCRDLIGSDWYQLRFGHSFKVRAGQDNVTRFTNDQKGYRLSVPTSGIMGDGGDFVILDDPHSVDVAESDDVRDEVVRLIRLALPTRVRNWKRGGAICIMQRLHWKDYCGTVLKNERDWDHLCFPARYESDHPFPVRSSIGFVDPRTRDGELLNPLRFDEARLTQLEIDMGGSYGAAGQMQQRPSPREGGMFQRKWWQYCSASDVPADAPRARGWDFAGSVTQAADYTANCKTAKGEGKVFLEHIERFKATPGEVERRFVQRCEADGYSVEISIPQDPGQAGKFQASHLLSLIHGYVCEASPESGSKEQRAKALAGQAEAGNVILVRGDWNDDFVDEAAMFPTGPHDDMVDAASRAYHAVNNYGARAGVW